MNTNSESGIRSLRIPLSAGFLLLHAFSNDDFDAVSSLHVVMRDCSTHEFSILDVKDGVRRDFQAFAQETRVWARVGYDAVAVDRYVLRDLLSVRENDIPASRIRSRIQCVREKC